MRLLRLERERGGQDEKGWVELGDQHHRHGLSGATARSETALGRRPP